MADDAIFPTTSGTNATAVHSPSQNAHITSEVFFILAIGVILSSGFENMLDKLFHHITRSAALAALHIVLLLNSLFKKLPPAFTAPVIA
jgi:hypothetical protein